MEICLMVNKSSPYKSWNRPLWRRRRQNQSVISKKESKADMASKLGRYGFPYCHIRPLSKFVLLLFSILYKFVLLMFWDTRIP